MTNPKLYFADVVIDRKLIKAGVLMEMPNGEIKGVLWIEGKEVAITLELQVKKVEV